MSYPSNKTFKFSYPIMDVITAACAAQRINGCYQKYNTYNHETETQVPSNKSLIYLALNNPGSLNITEEDVERAQEVFRFLKNQVLAILADKANGYIEALAELSQKEVMTSPYEIGLLASSPDALERDKKRGEEDVILFNNSKQLDAAIGTRRKFEIEVVRCWYSRKWEIFFVTGVTEGSTVFFSYRSELQSGAKITATATVAEHRDKHTKLSRVKINAVN